MKQQTPVELTFSLTPKEKAEELLNKMAFEVCKTDAKKCALIAVDEIIKNHKFPCKRRVDLICDVEYWQVVKKEIEKL